MWFYYKGWSVSDAKEYLKEFRNGNISINYNKEDAEKIYQQLPFVVTNDDIDQYAYALFLYRNYKNKNDISKVLKITDNLVARNFIPVYYLNGCIYLDGKIVTQNYSTAKRWYEKTLDTIPDFAPALYELGYMYLKGLGVPQITTKAVDLIHKSKICGYGPALNFEGLAYYNGGYGYPKDHFEAFDCFRASAFGKNPKAYYYLGIMYYFGHGCDQSYKQALDYYGLAAANDNVEAMYEYGLMCSTGTYVEKNISGALYYLEKASILGHAKAMGLYGSLLCTEKEAPYEKRSEGPKWIRKGVELGDNKAKEYAKILGIK